MTDVGTIDKTSRTRLLTCPWNHVVMWPVDLLPYPTDCPHKIASLPEGQMYCRKELRPKGVVLFERP